MVTSISTPSHNRKVLAARDTWGTQCDGWIVISNVTDPALGAIDIPLEAYDHDHLWEKTRKGLEYVWYQHGQQYDWFYKVDDDAFVIMNNLQHYLASDEIQAYQSSQKLIQLGHRFNLPEKEASFFLKRRKDPSRFNDFQTKFGTWFYNSGGSGYVMNQAFVETFVTKAIHQPTCWPPKGTKYATVSEDAAISFCMAYNGGKVINTRDDAHRERFHCDNPERAFFNGKPKADSYEIRGHERTGGYQTGKEAVSHEAIAFHYMKPEAQYYATEQLYYCRNPQWKTLNQFNTETPMRLPEE